MPFRASEVYDDTETQGVALGWHVVDPSGLKNAETALIRGLKIARDCGYGLYHIDLLLERARLHLLRGDAGATLKDIEVALDTGIPANEETGQVELLAANHEECGYAWAIPAGLQLRAEALLLRAAQKLGRTECYSVRDTRAVADGLAIRPTEDELPADVVQLVEQAKQLLHEALNLWHDLRDPEPTEDNNFKLDGKEYNYRAAETHQMLVQLKRGILTRYPLKGRTMKTIVELDLFGYSTICDLLEEAAGVDATANLNKEIQAFVDIGLASISAERSKVVMQTTGDGAILVLDQPSDAHQFAEAVHEATRKHNERKSKPVGKRVFRVGAATGDLSMTPKDGGGFEIAGMTIARAVRLEGKSGPGGLLVDPDTLDGLTEEQKKLYAGPEQIAGKRDESFTAYRCVMNPVAAQDVAYFLGQAKRKQEVEPIEPATRGVKRDERREILKRFGFLKPHQFADLVFLLDIPINRRPPDTVDLERQKKHILEWADEEKCLEDLLFELREFQEEKLENP